MVGKAVRGYKAADLWATIVVPLLSAKVPEGIHGLGGRGSSTDLPVRHRSRDLS